MSQILKPGDGVVIEYQGVEHEMEGVRFPTKDQSQDCLLEISYSALNFGKAGHVGGNDTATCLCREYKP
jgi:hypothetical protein